MKIVYIGKNDALAEAITERMGQEGHDVYFVSDQNIRRRNKNVVVHHFPIDRKGMSFEETLSNMNPDCIIFGGNHYIGDYTGRDSDADQELLSRSLRVASEFSKIKFILLSSIEVYGPTSTRVNETAKCEPVTERGIRFMREEKLLEIYKQAASMDITVLRASRLYTDFPVEGGKDILSTAYTAALDTRTHMVDNVFQPLYVFDFARAISAVLGKTEHPIYNVNSYDEISTKSLYEMVCNDQGLIERDIHWDNPEFVAFADCSLINQEFGWEAEHSIKKDFEKGKITFTRSNTKKEKKSVVPPKVRKTIENLFLFVVFCVFTYICAQVPVLAEFNWLLVYVILIALSYSLLQSVLASVLASAAYVVMQLMGIAASGGVASYADIILNVMEYIFFGFIVSYTTNTLRDKAQSAREDQETAENDYEQLRYINEENVLIKNEFEERLLASKTGFPKVYEMFRRLTLLEPSSILKESIPVISELVGADSIAVYKVAGSDGAKGAADHNTFELMDSSNGRAEVYGKSWNITDTPRIADAVKKGTLYQGELGGNEPAVVMPIVCNGMCVAIITVKDLPFESENLYHLNMLKTVLQLLDDSMTKAIDYGRVARGKTFISSPASVTVSIPSGTDTTNQPSDAPSGSKEA